MDTRVIGQLVYRFVNNRSLRFCPIGQTRTGLASQPRRPTSDVDIVQGATIRAWGIAADQGAR